MMRRDECLKVLAKHRRDEIVVSVYKAAQEWLKICPSDLNYTFTGAMGQGSSHALGLALGRPDKRIILLDGDGSLLMNLGSLVTIANQAPRNLLHFLCRNGTYESNGAVAIPNQAAVSFCGFAMAAGYRAAYEFSELTAFEHALPSLLLEDGPIFVDLAVEPGKDYPEDFERLNSVRHREAFIRALAAS